MTTLIFALFLIFSPIFTTSASIVVQRNSQTIATKTTVSTQGSLLVYTGKKSNADAFLSHYSSRLTRIHAVDTNVDSKWKLLRQEANSTSAPKPKGYTFDQCFTDNDCLENRECIRGDQSMPCFHNDDCYCVNVLPKEKYEEFEVPEAVTKVHLFQSCSSCTDCEHYPSETCVNLPSKPKKTNGFCGSTYPVSLGIFTETDCNTYPEITPDFSDNLSEPSDCGTDCRNVYLSSSPSPFPTLTPTPTSSTSTIPSPSFSGPTSNNDGCIDVKHLRHLQRKQLVYKEDRLANVLCDPSNNCATPGHMVVYHGSAMSMKSYCETLDNTEKCTKTVASVNSPKYSRRARIPSSTKSNLYFTALASKYESQLEETILRAVIYFGI